MSNYNQQGCSRVGFRLVDCSRVRLSMVCSVVVRSGSYDARSFDSSFTIGPAKAPYADLTKRLDYLYEVNYTNIDYSFAKSYFRRRNPQVAPGACTSVRSGNFFGRNHDWFYGNECEFVVRTPAVAGRHAVLGVAGDLSQLTKEAVEKGGPIQAYRLLPFMLLDGINDAHLVCNTNVVPTDKGKATQTIPSVEQRENICALMLTRYILDHFSSAREAVEYIRDYVAVYPSRALQEMGYEAHWMIADSTATYVMEFVDNRVVFREASVMTNFYLDGVTPNADGKVYTPADAPEYLASGNGITEHGSGLERFNLCVERLADASSKTGMRVLMNDLLYTKTYLSAPVVADPIWHTEYVGNLTVDSPAEDFADVEARYAEIFRHRDRNTPATEPRTWQTTHSSVYDLVANRLHVVSQEDTAHELTFDL